MIAASHLATTTAANTANSSNAAPRQDASSQSFSDSLGQARQAAHSHNEVEHNSQQTSSTKRQKDNGTAKVSAHRNDNDADTTTASTQQSEPVDQSWNALAIPTHVFTPIVGGRNNVAQPQGAQDSASAPSTVEIQPISTGSGFYHGGPILNSGLQSINNTTGGGNSSAIIGQSDFADAPDASLSSQQNTNDADAVSGGDSHVAARPTFIPSENQPTAAGTFDQANAVSTLTTAPAAPAHNDLPALATQNNGSNVNVPSVAAPASVTAANATTAFKGLQNINSNKNLSGTKNADSIANPTKAGAKETDSYLSIQKDTKSDAVSAKDSASNAGQQHSSHDGQSQQNAAVAPVVTPVANHTPISTPVHTQTMSAAIDNAKNASVQSVDTNANEAALNNAVAANQSTTSEHASTIVNSAKLMQSIGQSEMRVGMRTAEFGDISIRTSTTRDAISAEISLAHGDLAKTLSTHMPEMQTRLTSGEVVNVQIQHDGSTSSYDGDNGNANQGGSQSHYQEQPTSRTNFINSYGANTQSAVTSVPASVLAASSASAGRLDIRA